MRTLIVDDHNLVRAGIRRMLEVMGAGIEVVGETDNGRDALRLINQLDADLLITDLSMPDIEGTNLIEQAKKRVPALKCIVLSMHKTQDHVIAALRAGADGYVHKNATAHELLDAVKAVAGGETYLHPSIAGSVVDLLRDSEAPADMLDQLTSRQREILKLIAEGRSTREIAKQLSVSTKTVETHRSQLMDRLNIRNVPGLVKFAIRKGLVDIEST